ncbi:MAG TPA: alpha-L-fucosidase [Candidatus Atribacteria bacterium]|nr:alpha-L-fucosidase [Candidatus Atribacteria bacterium]
MKYQKFPEGPFEPTWESLSNYKIPSWFEEAKFGIFIHFGAYSVPAFGNEWYPRNMYIQGSREFEHHIKTYGEHNKFGYKDFIPLFKAEKFNPEHWANVFRKSGAKYVIPVAEHHDGFAMYDCSFTRWCAAKIGPQRDIVGELAQAARKNFLTFGISYHRAEHWWFFHEGTKFDSDVLNPEYIDLYGPAQPENMQPTEEFLENWYLRLCEIVDKYKPQIIYFDWWIEKPVFEPYLKRFAAYYYNRAYEWNREVVISYKLNSFPRKCALYDIERGKIDDIDPIPWQMDAPISKVSWSYVEEKEYKTTEEILCDLVDIVSKNGNLLLNTGPRPNGTIPEEEENILLEIGKWLLANGEAIYGTKPWKIYGEGLTKLPTGSFVDTTKVSYTGEDFRFTTKGDILYAFLMGKPEKEEIFIQSLGYNLPLFKNEIEKVEVLGEGRKEEIVWKREERGLKAKIPGFRKLNYPVALKITPK